MMIRSCVGFCFGRCLSKAQDGKTDSEGEKKEQTWKKKRGGWKEGYALERMEGGYALEGMEGGIRIREDGRGGSALECGKGEMGMKKKAKLGRRTRFSGR